MTTLDQADAAPVIRTAEVRRRKSSAEVFRDRRDTFEPESRQSVVPGTLPVTEGTALERETEIEVAQHTTSRPYTIPSRHERRRSS